MRYGVSNNNNNLIILIIIIIIIIIVVCSHILNLLPTTPVMGVTEKTVIQ